ncbi:MAG: GNAT family N-acetyltransferase [Verrucomicrobiales bacterium]
MNGPPSIAGPVAPIPSPFDPNRQPGPPPQAHLDVRDPAGGVLARCSLWWRDLPRVDGRRPGFIGHFTSGSETAAAALLRDACRRLAADRCELAIGPVDGSTWGNYRFVTASSGEPPFLFEPDHPPEWPAFFVDAGFWPLARYYSTATEKLDVANPKGDRAATRLLAGGCRIRTLESSRLTQELEAVHGVILAAFAGALLYQPMPRDAFVAEQTRIGPLLRPDLVLVAERQGSVVGFLFAIPDHRQAAQAKPIDTVIIKTLAVLPGRENAGLGVWLVRQLHRSAKALGFRRVIHALMHESNYSLNIHRESTRWLREYTLFARTL